jgi:hypothetical protein
VVSERQCHVEERGEQRAGGVADEVAVDVAEAAAGDERGGAVGEDDVVAQVGAILAAQADIGADAGADAVLEDDVANDITVTVAGLTLAGAQATDYQLPAPQQTTTANITPLALSAVVTAANKVYDGTAIATITSLNVTGVLAGDTISLVGGTGTFDSPNAGTSKTVTVSGLRLAGASASDYSIAPTATATANITPAHLIVSANNQTVNQGNPLPTLTATLSGFVNGETTANLTTPANVTTAARASSAAGKFLITPSGAADPNYAITFVPGTLNVDGNQTLRVKAPTQVTAHGTTATFGKAINVTASNPQVLFKVTLITSLGKLHIKAGTGLTIRGNGSGRVIITGNLAAVDKALHGLSLALKKLHSQGKITISVFDGTHTSLKTIKVH